NRNERPEPVMSVYFHIVSTDTEYADVLWDSSKSWATLLRSVAEIDSRPTVRADWDAILDTVAAREGYKVQRGSNLSDIELVDNGGDLMKSVSLHLSDGSTSNSMRGWNE